MTTRTIKTTFWFQKETVQINSSTNPNRAVAQCVAHMQVNHYGAQWAEVYDDASGALHAQVRRNVKGDINITYKRNPEDFEPMRLAASAVLVAPTKKRAKQ